MAQQHFLLNEVARLVERKPYQIAYLITTGVIPEPKLRINNKRVFTPEEVAEVRGVREAGDRAGRGGEWVSTLR